MFSLEVLIVMVVVMALAFDFVNGWNDSANAIATVVATRVLSPFTAVILASILNLTGALVGTRVADTMSKIIHVKSIAAVSDNAETTPPADTDKSERSLKDEHTVLDDKHMVLVIVITGLLSAAVWAAVMTVLGMPISGSHSLIGGVIGAAVAAAGVKVLVVSNIQKTLLAMLLAPAMGFVTAYFFYVALIWITVRWKPTTMNRVFGQLQILSASSMAFTHGTNDAQKVMGIITLALVAGGFQSPPVGNEFVVQTWVKIACAVAISAGTAVGGWKVMKTLGHHLTRLGPPEGFAAETSASLVLTVAAWLGVPTSTTHTITGAILGLGATRGVSSVRWGLGEKIMLAWVFTLPITAALGGTLYWIVCLFM